MVYWVLFCLIFISFVAATTGSWPLHLLDLIQYSCVVLVFGGMLFATGLYVIAFLSSCVLFVINWSFGYPLSDKNLVSIVGGFSLFVLTHWFPALSAPGRDFLYWSAGPILGTICGTLITYRRQQFQQPFFLQNQGVGRSIKIKDLLVLMFWVGIFLVLLRLIYDSRFYYMLYVWAVFQIVLLVLVNRFSTPNDVAVSSSPNQLPV